MPFQCLRNVVWRLGHQRSHVQNQALCTRDNATLALHRMHVCFCRPQKIQHVDARPPAAAAHQIAVQVSGVSHHFSDALQLQPSHCLSIASIVCPLSVRPGAKVCVCDKWLWGTVVERKQYWLTEIPAMQAVSNAHPSITASLRNSATAPQPMLSLPLPSFHPAPAAAHLISQNPSSRVMAQAHAAKRARPVPSSAEGASAAVSRGLEGPAHLPAVGGPVSRLTAAANGSFSSLYPPPENARPSPGHHQQPTWAKIALSHDFPALVHPSRQGQSNQLGACPSGQPSSGLPIAVGAQIAGAQPANGVLPVWNPRPHPSPTHTWPVSTAPGFLISAASMQPPSAAACRPSLPMVAPIFYPQPCSAQGSISAVGQPQLQAPQPHAYPTGSVPSILPRYMAAVPQAGPQRGPGWLGAAPGHAPHVHAPRPGSSSGVPPDLQAASRQPAGASLPARSSYGVSPPNNWSLQ